MSAVIAAVAVGAAVTAYATVKSGQAQQAQADAQAAQAGQNAVVSAEEGQRKTQLQQQAAQQQIGRATTQYASNGIDTSQGSALDVIGNSMMQAAADSNQIQYETQAKEQGYQETSASDTAFGDAAATGADLSAAGGVLSTAGTEYGIGNKQGLWGK